MVAASRDGVAGSMLNSYVPSQLSGPSGVEDADFGAENGADHGRPSTTQTGAGASTVNPLDPIPSNVIQDAMDAARRLCQQPSGSDEPESDGGPDSAELSAGCECTVAPTGGAEPGGSLPSRSSVRSLRLRPMSTARADSAVSAGEAYASVPVKTYKMLIHQARREPDWVKVNMAVEADVDSLWRNGTWELVNLPPAAKVTGTQMLCERKRGADGAVSRHKAHYVARGDTQVYLVDYSRYGRQSRATPPCERYWPRRPATVGRCASWMWRLLYSTATWRRRYAPASRRGTSAAGGARCAAYSRRCTASSTRHAHGTKS